MAREAASLVEPCAQHCASHILGAHFLFFLWTSAPSSSAILCLPVCLLVSVNLVIDACIFHLLPLLLQR